MTSTWYTVYRIGLALFMAAGVTLHFVSTLDTLGVKWFIYMTNQGIGLLTLHYLIYAGIVLGRRLRASSSFPDTFPALYSFSWGLQTCTATVALFITLVYWIVLHPFVVENNLIQGTWMETLNVFLHGVNSLSCLVDLMVTARPIRIHHFYLAIIFGVYYTIFSVVYWAAGGVGICMPRCDHLPTNSSLDPLDPSCPVSCDHYIYPILNWDSQPGLAMGMVVGSCLLMPLLQSFWWTVVWTRQRIKQAVTPGI